MYGLQQCGSVCEVEARFSQGLKFSPDIMYITLILVSFVFWLFTENRSISWYPGALFGVFFTYIRERLSGHWTARIRWLSGIRYLWLFCCLGLVWVQFRMTIVTATRAVHNTELFAASLNMHDELIDFYHQIYLTKVIWLTTGNLNVAQISKW